MKKIESTPPSSFTGLSLGDSRQVKLSKTRSLHGRRYVASISSRCLETRLSVGYSAQRRATHSWKLTSPKSSSGSWHFSAEIVRCYISIRLTKISIEQLPHGY